MRPRFFIYARTVIDYIDVGLIHFAIDLSLDIDHDISFVHVGMVDSISAQVPHDLV